jgi:hypothetical protein
MAFQRRGGRRRLGLEILDAEPGLLDQDPRELGARERAVGDEDLAELPARPFLLGEGRLELARDDEPAVDQVLAERPPGEVDLSHITKIGSRHALL